MKKRRFLVFIAAAASGFTACSQSPAGGAPQPLASMSAAEPRWTASIQSVKEDRINVPPDSVREKSFGSAQWTRGTGPALSVINLTFSYSGPERDLAWAILFGSCGSASLPLVPLSNFPELNVNTGGREQVNATLSVELPASGTFHIDIYKDRTGAIESLVACGNLRQGRG